MDTVEPSEKTNPPHEHELFAEWARRVGARPQRLDVGTTWTWTCGRWEAPVATRHDAFVTPRIVL